MKQVIFPKSRTTRKLYRKEPVSTTSSGMSYHGFKSVEDGEEEVYYQTTINLIGLESLARKAAKNASGRAVDGPLEVRIIERRRL